MEFQDNSSRMHSGDFYAGLTNLMYQNLDLGDGDFELAGCIQLAWIELCSDLRPSGFDNDAAE